jgi:hypothetical protein
MQDADYCYRLVKSGLKNYYLPNLKSEHIGHDVGDGSEYRRMKDEGLNKSGEIWAKAIEHYEKNNNYYL